MKISEKQMHCSVVKRSGALVPFRRERIGHAIEAAFRDTKKVPLDQPLDSAIKQKIESITDLVVSQAIKSAAKGACLTVEGIQDMVELTLMKNGHHDVARDYILYRDSRKAKRENQVFHLKISRRGKTAPSRFNPMKIASSIEWAFRRARKIQNQTPDETIATVNRMTQKIVEEMIDLASKGDQLYIDMIEDRIERELMNEKVFDVAKAFIIYRAEKAKTIEQPLPLSSEESASIRKFQVILSDGTPSSVTDAALQEKIRFACRNQPSTSVEKILEGAIAKIVDGMQEGEIDQALIQSAASKIETDPAYSLAASRLLLDKIYRETMGISASDSKLQKKHRDYFKKTIKEGVAKELLSPQLLDFDLDTLKDAMDLTKDDLFSFSGLTTLNDSYLMHHQKECLETPQIFWMRIAMGLAINEKEEKNQRAIEFYHVLSNLCFLPSTPTLFNAGTLHPQLGSGYMTSVMDELPHIFKTLADGAQISKWSGGIGSDWTYVRAAGTPIKSTDGAAQGIIPFLKIVSDSATLVSQANRRKGAMCAYLETWHLDIEDFLDLRKNSGDERKRAYDIHTAHWIPDLFMKRVKENASWTLFSPTDVPDLHDLYGSAFEKRYLEYEKMADEGKILRFKRIEATQLWRKMLTMLFETNHPWLTFKDPANIRSAQDHQGVIHGAGLCTEMLLNTSAKETAVCHLGSINLARHMTPKGMLEERLKSTIHTAVRMLDNAIDINLYPTTESKLFAQSHRPIGLGLMGFQDALYIQNISYASHAAAEFADRSMELISYYAILASTDLAKERGGYSTFAGSKWDNGYLPIDTIEHLEKERKGKIDVDRHDSQDWSIVRAAVKNNHLRNCSLIALAPTSTIAQIAGVTPSIDPIRKNLSIQSNPCGEWKVVNPYLVDHLKQMNLWDDEMIDDLLYFEGSIRDIERIPLDLKSLFSTAFEIEPEWLIECAALRQKWIDMGESLNLFFSDPSFKKLHQTYMLAWEKGLKSTYHLCSVNVQQATRHKDINKSC